MVKKEELAGNVEVVFYISFYEGYLIPQMDTEQAGFGIMSDQSMISLKSVLADHTIEPLHLEKLISLLSDNNNPDYTKREYESYAIHSMGSNVIDDLKYMLITPRNAVRSQLSSLLLDSAKVYVILALLGIVLSFFIAKICISRSAIL